MTTRSKVRLSTRDDGARPKLRTPEQQAPAEVVELDGRPDHLEQARQHRHAHAGRGGEPDDVDDVLVALRRRRDDDALDPVLLDHRGQVLDRPQQGVADPGAAWRGHAADHDRVEAGIPGQLALDERRRLGVADDQDALAAGQAHGEEARRAAQADQRRDEQAPEQERVRAPLELHGPHALEEEREDRDDGHQHGRLVERRLVDDEVVAVVEPGGLGDQGVQRQHRERPGRERRVRDVGNDHHGPDDGDHVGRQQRGRPTSSRRRARPGGTNCSSGRSVPASVGRVCSVKPMSAAGTRIHGARDTQ